MNNPTAEDDKSINTGNGIHADAAPPPVSLPSSPTGQLHGWRLYTVQLCLSLSLILSVMDSSVVATALVTIGDAFEDFERLQWVVLAYLLTYLGFALIFTRISDVIGRKWSTVAALLILMAFSLGAGLSQSLIQVIIFRALQGIGGAGCYSMALISLPEITLPEKFPLMAAAMGIVFAVSAVLGPTIGGVITTHSSWRWVFLFNVPCCGAVVALILFSWPHTMSPGGITFRQLDLIGCLLYIATAVLLVLALQEAGTGAYAWDSGLVIACLCISGLAIIAMAFWIRHFSKPGTHRIAPLFPARILKHRIILVNLVISTLVGYIFYTILVELPERFQIVNGKNPQGAGISLLPVSGASALGSGLGGALSSKRNLAFYTLTIGSAFILLGSGLMYSIEYDRSIVPRLYGFEVILGFGIGLIFSSSTVYIKLYANIEDAASAQGLMAQSRIVGGNIGLALATIILNQHFTSGLRHILSSEQIASLRQSLTSIETFTPVQAEAVSRVFSDAFRTEVLICAVLAAVCLVLCGFAFDRDPPSFAKMAEAQKVGNQEGEVNES